MKQTDEHLPLIHQSALDVHSSIRQSTLYWSHLCVEIQTSSWSSSLSSSVRKIFENKSQDKKCRVLLHDITGSAHPGQILAIMGTSGAGKTTLMRVLSGDYATNWSTTTGCVYLNGYLTTDSQRQKGGSIGYVEQHEFFIETLTLEEHLIFQAMLGISHQVKDDERRLRVKNIIGQLHLTKCIKTIIEKLSGGERKRLALATILLSDPQVLLIDEPTSGLDAYLAMLIMKILRSMAVERRRTVIVVLHQPTSAMFNLIDTICLLVEGGRQAFFGSKDEALEFFTSQCHLPPSSLDGFIEQLAVPSDIINDEGIVIQQFVADQYVKSAQSISLQSTIKHHLESIDDHNKLNKMNEIDRGGFCRQLKWIIWRSFLSDMRNPLRTIFIIVRTLVPTVIFGLIYLQLCQTSYYFENVNAINLVLVVVVINTSSSAIMSVMPINNHIAMRENYQGMYSIFAYYLAIVLHDLPSFIVLPCVIYSVVYWMSGMDYSWLHFLEFVGVGILASNTGAAFGQFFSSFSSSVESAISVAVPTQQMLVIFSGFFISLAHIPSVFRMFQYISPYYYSYATLFTLQWDSNSLQETPQCQRSQNLSETNANFSFSISSSDSVDCSIIQDKSNYNVLQGHVSFNICMLVLLCIICNTIAFIIIWCRAHRKQIIKCWREIKRNNKKNYQPLQ